MSSPTWQHPWLRIQRLIRSITQEPWHPAVKPLMKETLRDAIREEEKIRRAGWWNWGR